MGKGRLSDFSTHGILAAPVAEGAAATVRCTWYLQIAEHFAESVVRHRLAALTREHQPRTIVEFLSLLQHVQCLIAERNIVRPSGLGALTGDAPASGVQINLAPVGIANLTRTGTSEYQETECQLGPWPCAAVVDLGQHAR